MFLVNYLLISKLHFLQCLKRVDAMTHVITMFHLKFSANNHVIIIKPM